MLQPVRYRGLARARLRGDDCHLTCNPPEGADVVVTGVVRLAGWADATPWIERLEQVGP